MRGGGREGGFDRLELDRSLVTIQYVNAIFSNLFICYGCEERNNFKCPLDSATKL